MNGLPNKKKPYIEDYKKIRLKMSPLIIGAFILCAIIMFAAGIPRYLETKKFINNSVLTIGTVSEIEKGTRKTRAGTTKVAYYVIYTFITKNGGKTEGKSSVPRGPSDFKVNDQITILYDPNNPSYSKMKSFSDLWMHAFCFNFLGLVFTASGIYILMQYKQYLTNQSSGH